MPSRRCLHLPSQESDGQVILEGAHLARCSFPLMPRLQQSQCLPRWRVSYMLPSYGRYRHRPCRNTPAEQLCICGYTHILRHITIWKKSAKRSRSRSDPLALSRGRCLCRDERGSSGCLTRNRLTTAFGESARLLHQIWSEQEELPNDRTIIGFVRQDQVRRH
jgi:hypothetical protein